MAAWCQSISPHRGDDAGAGRRRHATSVEMPAVVAEQAMRPTSGEQSMRMFLSQSSVANDLCGLTSG